MDEDTSDSDVSSFEDVSSLSTYHSEDSDSIPLNPVPMRDERLMEDITDRLAGSSILHSNTKRNIAESGLLRSELHQITKLENRLRVLNRRRRSRLVAASLKYHGSRAEYASLSRTEQYKKENILAILSCPLNEGKLPAKLKESHWCAPCNVWLESMGDIYADEDVFLARVARKDFADYHKQHVTPVMRGNLCWFPETPKCINAMIAAVPQLYLRHAATLWMDDHRGLTYARTFLTYCDPESALEGASQNPLNYLLRDNEKLALFAVTKKNYQILEYLDAKLLDSVRFALRFVNYVSQFDTSIPRSLERFSERVRSDPNVAKAYVARWGQSYRHVHISTKKNNLALARSACFQDSTAILEYIPGHLEQKLVNDKELVLHLLRQSEWLGPAFWDVISSTLKYDFDVCVSAMASRYITSDDLPLRLKHERAFWRKALANNIDLWSDGLPESFRHDPSILEGLSLTETILDDCVCRFPYLRYDRNFWANVLWKWKYPTISSVMSRLVDRSLFYDKSLMIQACSMDPLVLSSVVGQLALDREVLTAAMSTKEENLLDVLSPKARRLYPDLCGVAISHCCELKEVPKILGLDEWQNRDVALAWLARGGPWIPDREHDVFPVAFLSDEEILLAAAGAGSNRLIFKKVPVRLRRKKSLMLRVLEKSPGLYTVIPTPLKLDFDILVRAFSNFSCLEVIVAEFSRDSAVLIAFSTRVRELIENKGVYTRTILCGMAKRSNSRLRALDQGTETSVALKRLFASLLDVPLGPDVVYLQQAHTNLTRLGL